MFDGGELRVSDIVSVLTGLLQASRPVAAPVGCLGMERGCGVISCVCVCVHA